LNKPKLTKSCRAKEEEEDQSRCVKLIVLELPQTRNTFSTKCMTIFVPSIIQQAQMEFDKIVGQRHTCLRV
jgi:hypothetical protein